jgi:hypothetical protein
VTECPELSGERFTLAGVSNPEEIVGVMRVTVDAASFGPAAEPTDDDDDLEEDDQ